VTPSLAAPGDTHPSDAAGPMSFYVDFRKLPLGMHSFPRKSKGLVPLLKSGDVPQRPRPTMNDRSVWLAHVCETTCPKISATPELQSALLANISKRYCFPLHESAAHL